MSKSAGALLANCLIREVFVADVQGNFLCIRKKKFCYLVKTIFRGKKKKTKKKKKKKKKKK